MASSNRHWPSMFKSKPCNSQHQWQHEINSSLISNGCQRAPSCASSGSEERSPEPKPRWNPRPEQIRILEAIFNSGMVNPPRDEIRKIRAQLQEYGQVGDANVFYWFQNRKSRSKHKQRHFQSTTKSQPPQIPHITSTPPATKTTSLSSSSSSSERSSQNSADKTLSLGPKNLLDTSSSATASVNQHFFQSHSAEFLPVPFFFPVQQPPSAAESTPPAAFSQGFCFSDAPSLSHLADNTIQNSSSLLLSDLLLMNHVPTKKVQDEKIKLQQQLNYTALTTPPITTSQSIFSPTSVAAVSSIDHVHGVGETGSADPTKSTVFINDVAFEVTSAFFNVREAFGDDAVLVHSSGQPVLTNEWGVTLQPLQHDLSDSWMLKRGDQPFVTCLVFVASLYLAL
nr:WUSCHEL-related homeobox 9-like isoform X1 [Coffea arabica]